MFKFLKDRLKKAVSSFSKKVEEEADVREEEVQEVVEKPAEKKPEARPEPKKTEKEKVKKEEKPEKVEDELEETKHELEKDIEELKEKPEEKTPKKKEPAEKKEEPEPKPPEPEKKEFLTDESPEKEIKQAKKSIEQEQPEAPRAPEQKKTFLKKLFRKKEKPEPEEKTPEKAREPEEEKPEETKPEKKGLFGKIGERFTTIKLSDEKFENLFWELEMALLENNVAVEVIEKIKNDLKQELTTGKQSRKGIDELIKDSLQKSIQSLFIDKQLDIEHEIKKKQGPYVIAFIGVNGSGKTTSMAKLGHILMKKGLKIVFAASDTFRAAAIQQLEEHADKLGVKMIKHDYESDPAAVAFDAVKHAQAKGIDAVLIDTAGRLHSNDNLMNELKKLIRVNQPDLKIFVGESITGNDCVEQAKLFDQAVGIDAIILSKADVDEKGGAAVSVSYVTKKPIIYLGTGQGYDDLTEFKPELVVKNIGL